MLSCAPLGRSWFVVAAAVAGSIVAEVPLLGQEPSGIKIGVFDADRLTAESGPGQEAMAILNQLLEQRQSELTVQQEQINGLRQQALTAVPGSPQAAQLQRQVEDRMLQYERLEQDVQQELAQRQNELIGSFQEIVVTIIETMGQEGGYTMIFSAGGGGLVYRDDSIDITAEIIERIEATSPAEPL